MKFTRHPARKISITLVGGKWGEHRDTVCSRIYDSSDSWGEGTFYRYIYIAIYELHLEKRRIPEDNFEAGHFTKTLYLQQK